MKVVTTGIVCMLVLCGFFAFFIFENDNVRANTYYVGGTGAGNYTKIQKAIDAAGSGDTVFVYAGTYYENVYVNKTINLIGASRSNTTIDASGSKDAIQVNANWVNISGFTIKNSGLNSMDAGIELNQVNNCSIMHNNISSNGYNGIYILGTKNVKENHIIEDNIISFNKGTGLYLRVYSSYNTIINNIIENNNKIKSNSEAGVNIYYFSNNNTISRNTIRNNEIHGILCYSSDYNVIKSNEIFNNSKGIFIPTTANGNIFYLNEFIKNTNHFSGSVSTQNWNSIEKISYFYNNTNFTNYLGNYWDDYSGSDINGDGIGESAYNVGSSKDSYPLVKTTDNYLLIPSSIEIDMNAVYSNSTNKTVTINTKETTLNASISRDLTGSINFTNLEFVTITSGFFNGKGFFKANWTATIEGKPYNGTWCGMLFNNSRDSKIYLKGTLFGGAQGISDGYLIESIKGSGVYDLYNSTSTINQLDGEIVFAELTLNGIVNYQKSINTTSEIYILQSLFKGNATGYYNRSLNVVLTHIRINNKAHQYYGQGFSIITYVSTLGAGFGWTYDKTISPNVVSLTGFFTYPILGIVFGRLDETGSIKKLSLKIIRLEMGLPPKAILDINIWGPYMLYPGQTVNYFCEVSNSGIKGAENTEIVMTLPINTTYINNTGNGIYNNITHEITWRQNISGKSKTLISAKVKIDWGLKKGTKLYCNGSIIDFIKNVTLASDSYNSSVLCAKDPNAKYGPEGDVIPGQKLNYRIEFENEGSGIAYGVYFIDTLSEFLDDSTLKIGLVKSSVTNLKIAPAGIYDQGTRTITWFVGEVGPGDGGYANLSINVRNDAKAGTEILNYGIVYFPSVPEVTRTNGIVSIVRINKNPTAIAGNNLIVNTLEEIIFDGSGSSDSDGTIMNYTWDLGDGEIGYGKVTSHSYLDDGEYKVKLTVTDNWDGKDFHEINIQVQNRPPEAKLKVDLTEVNTNDHVNFNAAESVDLDGTVSEYYFDFGDGTNSDWIQSPITSHKYSDGTMVYTVKLSIKDDDSAINENSAEVKITVNNREPLAQLSAAPIEAFTYEDILFNAELSMDPEGDISSYYFDFGDGANSGWITTSTASHQYTDGTNEYTIQLIVKDEDGDTDTTDLSIKIRNRAPHADAGLNQVVNTNQLISFNKGSSSDLDGKIKSYLWDFGDGSTGTSKKISHVYKDNGQYIVTLSVTDDDSAIGKDTCIITVNNVKPVSNFEVNPDKGDVTTLFQFTSTAYDTDGSITKFSWDFGDGMTAHEANPSHQYEHSGTYSVSLVVQDDDGSDSDVISREITLSNLPPVAHAESSASRVKVGEKITFDASKSYDLDGKIKSFVWRFSDGNYAYGSRVDHSYNKEDTYTITLTITDDYDNIAHTFLKIEIIKELIDSDGDGLSNDEDPDDDNDGMPDNWEEKYGLTTTDPTDAAMDLDNDNLNNLDEYLHDTNPDNQDTDGDDLLDGEEINKYFTDATNPDTDGDGYIDGNDPDPTKPANPEKPGEPTITNIQLMIIFLLIIVIIILAITPLIIRKKRRGLIGEPYSKDETLRNLSYNVLTDNDRENLTISRDRLKKILETSHEKSEISENTYKYIAEDILYSEENKQ